MKQKTPQNLSEKETQDGNLPKAVTPTMLFVAAIAAQLFSAIPLWSHESVPATFLGRYSSGYGIALIGSLIIGISWLGAFVAREQVLRQLGKIPTFIKTGIILVSGLFAFLLWLQPVEIQLRQHIALNWILLSAVLIRTVPDQQGNTNIWRIILALSLITLLIPILITSMTGLPFSPDEAHWADIATSIYVTNGVYARTWMDEPVLIKPGIGWSVPAYGWFLENVTFDIRAGRIWNAVMYMLAIAGTGGIAARLYGRHVATAVVAFAILSMAFFPVMDYRPDHQLPFAMTGIMLAVVQARYGKRSLFWHFLAGLLATLSLQLHAAGIVYVIAFSAFYGLEAALRIWQNKEMLKSHFAHDLIRPLLLYASGATIGTIIYFFFNILPVGGLEPFLNTLIRERFSAGRVFFNPLSWPSLLENAIILAGFAYMIWRRNREDQLLLSLFGLILLTGLYFDSQGYLTLYQAMAIIPVGVLLISGFRLSAARFDNINRHAIWISGTVFVMLIGQMIGAHIDWKAVNQVLRTGEFPPLVDAQIGKAVAEYLQKDDILVGTHLLIWGNPDRLNFYSASGEINAARRWKLDNTSRVWERIGPTVIIHVENRMWFPSGLIQYMENKDFRICNQFNIGGSNITIYRMSCPDLTT